MWGLPGPGLEPVSPALAGGFLTTAPPRKYLPWVLKGKLHRMWTWWGWKDASEKDGAAERLCLFLMLRLLVQIGAGVSTPMRTA